MNTKKVLIPAIAIALVGTGALLKVSLAEAASNNSRLGLIQYLSQKLGVDQSKVETIFNDYHSQQQDERQKEMTENLTVYLDGLVKQGKITDAQKTAILSKHAELQKTRESTDWSSKTPEERRTAMEKQRGELETWAKQQGIDISYLRFGFGGRGEGRGFGGGKGHLMNQN